MSQTLYTSWVIVDLLFICFTSQACLSRPECGRQKLDELLIRPVQRLPSMNLLLSGKSLKHTWRVNGKHNTTSSTDSHEPRVLFMKTFRFVTVAIPFIEWDCTRHGRSQLYRLGRFHCDASVVFQYDLLDFLALIWNDRSDWSVSFFRIYPSIWCFMFARCYQTSWLGINQCKRF